MRRRAATRDPAESILCAVSAGSYIHYEQFYSGSHGLSCGMARHKLKLTVLKRTDPDEFFDELPVEKEDWFVPCGIYEDNQEIIVEENLAMPSLTVWNPSQRSLSPIRTTTASQRPEE